MSLVDMVPVFEFMLHLLTRLMNQLLEEQWMEIQIGHLLIHLETVTYLSMRE